LALMETRLYIAYSLILLLTLLAAGGIFHLTRDRRANRRQDKRATLSRRKAKEDRQREERTA
jgi:hypothetical protein